MSFLFLPFPGQIFKKKNSCIIGYSWKVFHTFDLALFKGHTVELVLSVYVK